MCLAVDGTRNDPSLEQEANEWSLMVVSSEPEQNLIVWSRQQYRKAHEGMCLTDAGKQSEIVLTADKAHAISRSRALPTKITRTTSRSSRHPTKLISAGT
jgi:hypothetical protein